MYECTYYDLRAGKKSRDISLLFPGWQPGRERIAIVSPHDDDAALGAGYLALAAQEAGGEVWVVICCSGNAGYSTPAQKETIVEVRRQETVESCAELGIPGERIVRYDYPDLSLAPNIGLEMPWGGMGAHQKSIGTMRRIGVTRLLIPNGYREHMDHTAAYNLSAFDAPQVGDPILADWGLADAVRSTLVYSVWGDFAPEDALVSGAGRVRANRALVAPREMEERIARSLARFRSQGRIIEDLLAQRRGRFFEDGAVELYLDFDARPKLDYTAYHSRLREIG